MDPATPVPIERLLEHRAWVRALARALVLDDARADDVAQEAWLAAIRHPPRHDAGLRAWLGRLVRHRAANLRRDERRREAREGAPLGDRDENEGSVAAGRRGASHGTSADATDPADAVARIEEHGRVVRAVLSLQEPYRTAIVLRFYDDLGATEIAARTGTPVETVRTRLKRGVAMLRLRLEDEHGGGEKARGALVLLAGMGGTDPAAPWIGGGLAVTTNSKVAAALAVLAAALLLTTLLPDGTTTPDAPPAPTLAPPAPTVSAPAATRRVRSPDETTTVSATPVRARAEKPPAPVAALAPEPATGPRLVPGTAAIVGRVRMADGTKSAEGVEVALSGDAVPRRVATTDARGAFAFEGVPDDRLVRVVCEVAGFAPVVVPGLRLDRDERRDLGVLTLDRPLRLDVVVRDWADRPIAGATVAAHRDGMESGLWIGDLFTSARAIRDAREPAATATTDAEGRAAFAALPPGSWTVTASADGWVPARLGPWRTAPGARTPEILLRLDRGLPLAGRVVDATGGPVAGATVWATGSNVFGAAEHAPHATTGSDGEFALTGVPEGDATMLVGRAGRAPAQTATVRVPASGTVVLVVGESVVEGRVTCAADGDDAGAPVAGARVLALLSTRESRTQPVAEAVADGDGRYTLAATGTDAVLTFRVERAGFLTLTERGDGAEGGLVLSGGRATRDFVLRRGVRLAGRVVGPDGPVARAAVAADWLSGGFVAQTETTAGDDGTFAFTSVPVAPVFLRATAPGLRQTALPSMWVSALLAGKLPECAVQVSPHGVEGVVVRLERATPVAAAAAEAPSSPDSAPKLHVSGRVTAPGGSPPPGTSVEVLGPQPGAPAIDFAFARVPVGADGRYEARLSATWRPSRLHVRARAPGLATGDSGSVRVPANAADVEIDVALAETCVLAGCVVSAADGGSPVAGARVSLLGPEPEPNSGGPVPLAAVADAEGRFRIDSVAPGAHRLSAVAAGFARGAVAVTAPLAGEVTLRLEPGLEIAGVVALADGTPVPRMFVSLNREDTPAGGENWWSVLNGPDGRFRVAGLRAGTYRVGLLPAPGCAVSVRHFEQKGVAAGTTDLTLVPDAARRIAGRVLDDRGRPVAGSWVMARSETGDRFTPSAQSAKDGTFAIAGIGAGTWLVEAKPPEVASYAFASPGRTWLGVRVTGITPDGDPVEIRLVRGLEISGTLTAADGSPLPSVWVRADPVAGAERDLWLDDARSPCGAETGASGAFRITGLRPGTYRLSQVVDPWGESSVLALDGGAAVAGGTSGVRVRAGGVGEISGLVVDEDGSPIAKMPLKATPSGGGAALWATTDDDGRFTFLRTSDATRYDIVVRSVTLVPAQAADVAAGTSDLRLVLRRGLECAGRIVRADGTPFASQSVRLTLADIDRVVSTTSDADGRFTAKGLTDGTWRVEAWLPDSRGSGRFVPCGSVRAGDLEATLRATE